MKIKDLTDEQCEAIAKVEPEWMAYNRPEWMADNRPEWMAAYSTGEVPEEIANIINPKAEQTTGGK